ncbi:carboxylesterase 2 [Spatholobus suberectus]|nr:carboxylesterase 2 [Spatholobus suberectus]
MQISGKCSSPVTAAGANIVSYLGIRVGTEGLHGVKQLQGIVLIHPFFWGEEPIGCEANRPEQAKKIHDLWRFACPSASGSDDPIVNPGKDPKVGNLACGRLLLCVAEKDLVRDRGLYYKELLDKNGWYGVVEVVEAKDEDHVFHLFKPNCENAQVLLNQIVSFLKQD